MKRNNIILMIFVGLILITSGCMENNEDASTEAVAINEFSVTPNPSPSDQEVRMEMTLENAGDATATEVTANIFGPTITNGDDRSWTAEEGTNMQFNELREATDTQPAIPQRDSIRLTTPDLEDGRNLPYDFFGQIFYGYATSASTRIQVMSQERYQDTSSTQRSPTVRNSNGPIQLTVQGTTPIVFQPEEGERTQELCIVVRNSGTGTPFKHDSLPVESDSGISDESENTINLEIENVGNIVFTAEQEQETETDNGVESEVDIIGNKGFHCFTMTAAGLGDITELEQTANIQIEANYGYTQETSSSVTVEGRR